MSSITIYNIKPFQKFDSDKTYLLLIKVNQTPPHIAIVQNGGYYSYSTHGVKIHSDINAFLSVLNKKQTPSIVIELNTEISSVSIKDYYINLNSLNENQSCLVPIKKWLVDFNNIFSHTNFIFDMIPILEGLNLISNIYNINAQHLILENNSFVLSKYNQNDINKAINNAKQLC